MSESIDNMIHRLTDQQRGDFMLWLLPWSGPTDTDDAVKVARDVASSLAQCAALCTTSFSKKDAAFNAAWHETRAWQRKELERMLGEGGGA